MPKTKTLALTSTPQDIVVQTVCRDVIIKEDESVANWPTTALNYRGSSADDTDQRTAGKSIAITHPSHRGFWQSGDKVGQVWVPSGSTTGIQYEQ